MPISPDLYKHFTDNYADRIVPLDLYLNDLERALSDACWNENDEDERWLQKRIESVKFAKDLGEEYYLPW